MFASLLKTTKVSIVVYHSFSLTEYDFFHLLSLKGAIAVLKSFYEAQVINFTVLRTKIQMLSILSLASRRDPRKLSASTIVPVLARLGVTLLRNCALHFSHILAKLVGLIQCC